MASNDVVLLVPGFFGFSRFLNFYYFADRVSASLRGALEYGKDAVVPVLRVATSPTGSLAPRQAMGEEAGDGSAAGVVGAEDLAQEDPQRNQRGEDAVQPAGEGGQRLGDDRFGEDVGERQVAVLKELPSQGAEWIADRSGVAREHGGDLLGGEGVVVRLHLPPRGPLRLSPFCRSACVNLGDIRGADRRALGTA